MAKVIWHKELAWFCMRTLVLSMMIFGPAVAHDNGMVPYHKAQISRSGFQWWQDFARARAAYRTDAVHCHRLGSSHDNTCWSDLAKRISLSQKVAESDMVKWPYCSEVQKSVARYWRDLAGLARYAGRTGQVPANGSVTKQAKVALDAAQAGLRHMADTGKCF